MVSLEIFLYIHKRNLSHVDSMADRVKMQFLSYVYQSAKFDVKFFNFFARLFILFSFLSKKFCRLHW